MNYIICTGQSVSPLHTYTNTHTHAHDKLSFLLARKRRECERKQDQAREGQAVTEPRTSLHWHHSDQPSSFRETGLAATFPALYLMHAHTRTALFYLSGCCLLAIWPGSLCLSACPLHKPNNATLLRLLRTWPAAQWKKRRRRRTPGGGRGK